MKRSCGRVARLSSAKAATAVRIRTGPLQLVRERRAGAGASAFLFLNYITAAAVRLEFFLP